MRIRTCCLISAKGWLPLPLQPEPVSVSFSQQETPWHSHYRPATIDPTLAAKGKEKEVDQQLPGQIFTQTHALLLFSFALVSAFLNFTG